MCGKPVSFNSALAPGMTTRSMQQSGFTTSQANAESRATSRQPSKPTRRSCRYTGWWWWWWWWWWWCLENRKQAAPRSSKLAPPLPCTCTQNQNPRHRVPGHSMRRGVESASSVVPPSDTCNGAGACMHSCRRREGTCRSRQTVYSSCHQSIERWESLPCPSSARNGSSSWRRCAQSSNETYFHVKRDPLIRCGPARRRRGMRGWRAAPLVSWATP